MTYFNIHFRRFGAAAIAVLLSVAPSVPAQIIRVVSWNTANDVGNNGTDSHPPGTSPWTAAPTGIFQAIQHLNVSGFNRPIDILCLQESVINTSGTNPTAQAYANILNGLYGAGTYSVGMVNGQTDSAATGNGPQTIVYRNSTVTLVSETALGTVGSSPNIPRQVMQYKFQPIGQPSLAFYVYNDHFKSGTTSDDNLRRGTEATVINNATRNLPNNTPIIYAGDYNPSNQTSDAGYSGVVTGNGTNNNHAVDPLNPNNVSQTWDNSANKRFSTESPATSAFFTGQDTGGMQFRDDFLMNSPGMLSGSIHYVAGSFDVFGNTDSHTYGSAVTTGSALAFSAQLTGYTTAQASTVLTELTQASDHLPVVADYLLSVPEPTSFLFVAIGGLGMFYWRSRRTNCALTA
jgi:endonuclease/exonuclease/phosphatase family metal-dependent hydrolase